MKILLCPWQKESVQPWGPKGVYIFDFFSFFCLAYVLGGLVAYSPLFGNQISDTKRLGMQYSQFWVPSLKWKIMGKRFTRPFLNFFFDKSWVCFGRNNLLQVENYCDGPLNSHHWSLQNRDFHIIFSHVIFIFSPFIFVWIVSENAAEGRVA